MCKMDRRYGCAVLAGGAGRRMGHINKADLEYEGRPFAETITAEMAGMGLPCYLSIASYEQVIPAGWKVVSDAVTGHDGKFIGPMGGIYTCLIQAKEDGLDGLFFAPCDAPFYRSEVSGRLGEHIDSDTDVVLWKTADGRLQTTFGWYSVNCISSMKEDIEASKYKLLKTIDKLRCKVVDTEDEGLDDSAFRNINHTEDYLELVR
ncbi:MAG: molybdenum cofactor guanylyltransferase [Mogibacterium sp.]|nr:molybdenum cofactor guanylyltransferase [Mogibacterium sp.]